MATDKPFKTIDEQIDLLNNKRHLSFNNEEAAKNLLQRYGYYEIINGYKTPFLIDPANDDKGFADGASFEHIFDLYKLDRNIRRDLLQSLDYFEQTFKQSLAYTISELISEDQNRYTSPLHYNTGKSRNGRHIHNDRDNLLLKFNKLGKSNKQPFKHYREDHNNVPPWIMIKGLTFGESIYWYRLSKPDIRLDVISKLMNSNPFLLKKANKKLQISQTFGDLLGLYLNYRNLAAHGGRIYNHRSERYRLRWSPLIYPNIITVSRKEFNKGKFRSSVGTIDASLKLFDNPEPYTYLNAWLRVDLEDYFQKHEDDKEYLLNTLELDDAHTKFAIN